MELDAFFAMVTGLKTACTHAGIDPKTAHISLDGLNGDILSVQVTGEGKHGHVTIRFNI